MKADGAKQDRDAGESEPASRRKPPSSAELPLPTDDRKAEEDDGGAFSEAPTVANRALPVSSAAGADEAPTAAPRQEAGTYRLVRPTVSDFVDQPVATKIDSAVSGRTVIGSARKAR